MTTDAKGFALGWTDAERFARGNKADRRDVLRRIAKGEATFANAFYAAYFAGLGPRAEAFGVAIREGRIARTCRPSRLFAVANRVGC
jgi:hypothetical protein